MRQALLGSPWDSLGSKTASLSDLGSGCVGVSIHSIHSASLAFVSAGGGPFVSIVGDKEDEGKVRAPPAAWTPERRGPALAHPEAMSIQSRGPPCLPARACLFQLIGHRPLRPPQSHPVLAGSERIANEVNVLHDRCTCLGTAIYAVPRPRVRAVGRTRHAWATLGIAADERRHDNSSSCTIISRHPQTRPIK